MLPFTTDFRRLILALHKNKITIYFPLVQAIVSEQRNVRSTPLFDRMRELISELSSVKPSARSLILA